MNAEIAREESRLSIRLPRGLSDWRVWVFALALALVWSLYQAGVFQRDLINPNGWTLVAQFFLASLKPAVDAATLRLTVDACLVTVAYGVCGLAISLAIGFVGGVLSSEVWWMSGTVSASNASRSKIWRVIRALFVIPRAVHEVIWALFFINIFGLDPLSGVLALGLPFGAITAKVFSEIFDETPRAPMTTLLHAGASRLNAFFYAHLPQALPNLLSYSLYRFECAIRSATVLGLIGAGGLGYQIHLSLVSLRYNEMWTFLFALILLSGLTDAWSSRLRIASSAPTCSTISGDEKTAAQLPRIAKWSAVAFVAAVPLSFFYIAPDFGKLFSPQTFFLFMRVMRDSFPPSLESGEGLRLISLAGQTLAMSVLAMTLAGALGLATSFFAANNVMTTPAQNASRVFTRLFLLMCRAIPAPVFALLFLFVFFPGLLPGVLALAVHNAGILGRLMSETVENADMRPMQAMLAQGATKSQALLYAIAPSTLPQSVSYALYRWEVCARETLIVGLVGAGGLGRLMQEQLSSFDYRGVAASLLAVFAITFIVDAISATVRRTIR
jgi:phosphonate transport system permease protein